MSTGDKHRLLVVEDHADTAMASARLLMMHGYHVAVAQTRAETLKLCRAEKFDLLLVDLGLPDGDGAELLAELLHDGGTVRAIAVSGYTMNEDLQRCRDAGFVDYIAKPVVFPNLLAKVRLALDGVIASSAWQATGRDPTFSHCYMKPRPVAVDAFGLCRSSVHDVCT